MSDGRTPDQVADDIFAFFMDRLNYHTDGEAQAIINENNEAIQSNALLANDGIETRIRSEARDYATNPNPNGREILVSIGEAILAVIAVLDDVEAASLAEAAVDTVRSPDGGFGLPHILLHDAPPDLDPDEDVEELLANAIFEVTGVDERAHDHGGGDGGAGGGAPGGDGAGGDDAPAGDGPDPDGQFPDGAGGEGEGGG